MLDSIPFETFIGPCRVLDFSNEEGKAVTKKFLETKYIKKGERILFKTKNSLRGFETFYDDYIFLSGDAAEYLASLEVLLVGIDSLSVKERGSKDNRPHTALLSKNIPILEGVNLKDVEEGEYELICPPLKFLDIDGSPTRAVLLQLL
jgi:arylformamidase